MPSNQSRSEDDRAAVRDVRPTVAFDAEGRLAESVACRGCGYDLTGLAPEMHCPECGMTVDRSVRGDRLRVCEPAWLRGLRRGARWTAWGTLVTIGLTLLFATAMSVLVATGSVSVITLLAVAAASVGLALAVAIVAGIWLMTVPEAARIDAERPLSARRVARIGAIAYIVLAPVQIVLNGAQGTSGLGSPQAAAQTILVVLLMILTVVNLAGWFGLLVHVAHLARRGEAPRLARQAEFAKWGYVGFGALSLVGVLLMMVVAPQLANFGTPTATGPPAATFRLVFVGLSVCGGTGVFLVFQAWLIAILFQFARLVDRVLAPDAAA